MTDYYFEIETRQTGWLRVCGDSLEDAVNDVKKNGFDVCNNLIERSFETTVVSIEGGEEVD